MTLTGIGIDELLVDEFVGALVEEFVVEFTSQVGGASASVKVMKPETFVMS